MNTIKPTPIESVEYIDKTEDVGFASPSLENVKIISKIEDFFALRDEWNAINFDSPKGTIFVSWEWLYTWWETYGNDGSRKLYILTCKNRQNELIGIAPFQIIYNSKKYFPCSRQLIMLGTGETDGCCVFGEYMDLIIKSGYETDSNQVFCRFFNTAQELYGME